MAWFSSEAPRAGLQARCASCGAYVKRKGQLCETCKRRKKTRQHTLDQGRLEFF
jgi:uncharacterized OB-fold protein